MEKASAPTLHPAMLPPGTQVGPWRLVAWAGRGVYGAVYRAVSVQDEHAAPVALKLALIPRDPRFVREVELLSRLSHPSAPRLVGHGEWQHPGGTLYPFIAMEWVDGVPLYDWARLHPPASQQVLRWLAQLARVLQALHSQGAVHRDVKGDNVLVRRSDSRALLTDFGSGIYPGATTLTPPTLYPGTPAYRSPECWLFDLQFYRDPAARYSAGPADDLYALGVTACRLLTGEYPEFAEPTQDEHGLWHLEAVLAPPALLHTEPRLRDLVLRMLSVRTEERGTAAQLAEALEQAEEPPRLRDDTTEVRAATPWEATASVEMREQSPETPSLAGDSAEPPSPRVSAEPFHPWRALVATGVAMAVWAWCVALSHPVQEPSVAPVVAAGPGQLDAGPTGLGEALAASAAEFSPEPRALEVMAQDTPPEPQPGQARPDAKGRCPRKRQVALNGGCWVEIPFKREECEDNGGYVFKKMCYLPFYLPGRPPTSNPTDKP